MLCKWLGKIKDDNYQLIIFYLQYRSVGNWAPIIIFHIISVCETILPLAADFVLYSTNRHSNNYCCNLNLPFYLLRKYTEYVWIIKYFINVIFLSTFDRAFCKMGNCTIQQKPKQQELVLLRLEESWDTKNVKQKRSYRCWRNLIWHEGLRNLWFHLIYTGAGKSPCKNYTSI